MSGRAIGDVKGRTAGKIPGPSSSPAAGRGLGAAHCGGSARRLPDLLPAEADRGRAPARPRSGDPCPGPGPRRRRARAEPPFRALGTGALGSAPGRGGAQGGGAACTAKQGRGEVRVRVPRTCTWKHSSRKCKHLQEREGEVFRGTSKRGARGQTETPSESQTGVPTEPGHPDKRPRMGSPRREHLQASAGGGR